VGAMTAPSSVKPSQLPVTGVKTPPAGGPTLGLAEAAKACGVSVSTLRRKRPELAALGAAQTATGWRIPITALIALGLMDRTTGGRHDGQHDTPMTPTTTAPVDALTAPVDALTAQLDALRTALADAERRAVAEAVAAERERMIQTQAMALRMLEASKPPATPTPTITTQPAESPSPAPSKEDPQDAPKRPWWRRR
jgi:hypothetical protein